jgi:hypothetical protein
MKLGKEKKRKKKGKKINVWGHDTEGEIKSCGSCDTILGIKNEVNFDVVWSGITSRYHQSKIT